MDSPTRSSSPRRTIVIVIFAALAAVVAYLVYERYYVKAPSANAPAAVVPFSQLSPEEQARQKEIAAQNMADYTATLKQPTEAEKAAAAAQMKKYSATLKQPTEAEKAAAAEEMAKQL